MNSEHVNNGNRSRKRRSCSVWTLLVLAFLLPPLVLAAHHCGRCLVSGAAQAGHFPVVWVLITFDPFLVNSTHPYPADLTDTPVLSWAVANRRTAVVKLLISRGADVNRPNSSKYASRGTPLHFAAEHADAEITRLLIQKGALVNTQDLYGETALHLAAKRGHVGIIKVLLASKANPNIRDRDHLLPLDLAIQSGEKEAYAMLRIHTTGGMPGIHVAASFGDVRGLARELSRNPKLANADYAGLFPLHLAADHGHLEAVNYLLVHGAEVDPLYRRKKPLYMAVVSHHDDVVRSLVEHGANVNIIAEYGDTPLSRAVTDADVPLVKYLVTHGADVNLADKGSYAPLHHAASDGNLEMVSYLVEHGADTSAIGNGYTPLQLAREGIPQGDGYPAVVRYLENVSSSRGQGDNAGQ